MKNDIPIAVLMKSYAAELDARNALELRRDRETAAALREARDRLECARNAPAPSSEAEASSPVSPMDALRQIINTKVNGTPVTTGFLLVELNKLIPASPGKLRTALETAERERLIERTSQFGRWRKISAN